MQRQNIDSGNAFDWGKTSQDYGKFRDIYPPLFYQDRLSSQVQHNQRKKF